MHTFVCGGRMAVGLVFLTASQLILWQEQLPGLKCPKGPEEVKKETPGMVVSEFRI